VLRVESSTWQRSLIHFFGAIGCYLLRSGATARKAGWPVSGLEFFTGGRGVNGESFNHKVRKDHKERYELRVSSWRNGQ